MNDELISQNPRLNDEPQVTHAMEDYLKAVWRLRERGEPVTTQRLADELGVSGPSVTNMAKRLHELRLVRHTRY
ncbi:MAG: DtxR family transcriptional regulator, partial [Chloroflexota bacterium]